MYKFTGMAVSLDAKSTFKKILACITLFLYHTFRVFLDGLRDATRDSPDWCIAVFEAPIVLSSMV